VLKLCSEFLNQMLQVLADEEFEVVLEALRSAPVYQVYFFTLPSDPLVFGRWNELCTALQIAGALKMVVMNLSKHTIAAASIAIEKLQQVTHLALEQYGPELDDWNGITTQDIALFAEAFRGLSCLEHIDFCLSSPSYRLILPVLVHVLRDTPFLNKLRFHDDSIVDPMDAQALVPFVQMPLEIELCALRFSNAESGRYFCNGIRQSLARSMHLDYVLIDPILLANSLASSLIEEIHVSRWPTGNRVNVSVFLKSLANRLPVMPLKMLAVDRILSLYNLEDENEVIDWEDEKEATLEGMKQAMPLLIRRTTLCLSLHCLKISLQPLTYKEIDEALAFCARAKTSRLDEVIIAV
jgi:hypothetical protein